MPVLLPITLVQVFLIIRLDRELFLVQFIDLAAAFFGAGVE